MGRKSIKENKTPYQLAREELGWTRSKASEVLETISDERIEKIENEKSYPHPDEVALMADIYRRPELCNYYCSHECALGMNRVKEVELKGIEEITLNIISTINRLSKQKDDLIDIAVDGEITEDEYQRFKVIHSQLENLEASINSLKLWVQKKVLDGDIDEELLED